MFQRMFHSRIDHHFTVGRVSREFLVTELGWPCVPVCGGQSQFTSCCPGIIINSAPIKNVIYIHSIIWPP